MALAEKAWPAICSRVGGHCWVQSPHWPIDEMVEGGEWAGWPTAERKPTGVVSEENWVQGCSHVAVPHQIQPQASSSWAYGWASSFPPHFILGWPKCSHIHGFTKICWVFSMIRQCPKQFMGIFQWGKQWVPALTDIQFREKEKYPAIAAECDHFWAKRRCGDGSCGIKEKDSWCVGWTASSLYSYVHVLTPQYSECDCVWR